MDPGPEPHGLELRGQELRQQVEQIVSGHARIFRPRRSDVRIVPRLDMVCGARDMRRLHGAGQDELAGVDAGADAEPGAIAVGEPLETDRSAALRVRGGDRLALAEAAVEADREGPHRFVGDRAAHPDDTADVPHQRLGVELAVAGAQDDQLVLVVMVIAVADEHRGSRWVTAAQRPSKPAFWGRSAS
jgi:hypothetical protein